MSAACIKCLGNHARSQRDCPGYLPFPSLTLHYHFHLALVLFQFPAVAQENRTAALNSCTSQQANVDPLHAHLAALYLCACLASVWRVA